MIKKIISLLIIFALPIGFAGIGFSAQESDAPNAEATIQQVQCEKEEECTVIKIEKSMIVLRNDNDEQSMVNISDSETLKTFKVGDKVVLKNGKVTKEKEKS